MEANELRIGNKVLRGDAIETVTGIIDEGIYCGVDDCEGWERVLMLDEIEPIPLTPEIFVLNGCGEDNNGHFLLDLQTHYLEIIPAKDGYYPVYGQKMEMSGDNDNRVSLNRISYVHQYQNLYFTLTGEELNIDL